MHDVIIIGGGPAGLQAALTLGRMHKGALLLDSGAYRNGRVTHMHNFLTHDGTPPAKFREQAHADIASYDTVEVRDLEAERVERLDGGFRVHAAAQQFDSRLLILATGVRDEVPDIPGLDDLWGGLAFGCPFCHGHELSGRHIGVLGGARAGHLVGLLAPIGESVTVFTHGEEISAEAAADLERLGARVVSGAVRRVTEADGRAVLITDANDEVTVDGLFVGVGDFVQSAPFAEQLGLNLLDSGCIAIDDFGRTSLPGVFAAGDLAHRPSLPMPMASVLAAAAAGQSAAASSVAELLMH